jgi:hypothetical protein
MEMDGQCHITIALPPRKRHVIHCAGGLLSPRAGLDGCGNSGLAPRPVQPVASRYTD